MKIIDKIRTGISYIFWIIFILSVTPALLNIFEVELKIDDLINTINIISISLFFVLEIVVEYILIPQADSKRRDDFIDNVAPIADEPDNDGIDFFDLNEATDDPVNGILAQFANPANLEVTYYVSQADADAEINEIMTKITNKIKENNDWQVR